MKTVSGAVVSSKPVSLSKAAKILSKFALADNGASPAYVAYLKRASDSFDELVQFHKELRGSGSERKSKKHRFGNHIVEKPVDSITNHSKNRGREDSIGTRKKDGKEKKAQEVEKKDRVALANGQDPKKKKNMMGTGEGKGNGNVKKEEQSIQESLDDSRESRKRKKELKKIKKEADEEGRSNGAVEAQKESSRGGNEIANGGHVESDDKNKVFEQKKSKKANKGDAAEKRENKAAADLRIQGIAGEAKVEDQNEGKRSKKRKSEEIADREVTGSAEKQVHRKKKKKVKSESDT